MRKLVGLFLVAAMLCLTACGNLAASSQATENPYLVLVNKANKLPDNWESKITLVTAKNEIEGDDREFKVEKEALNQFLRLRQELLDKGIDIELDSTYRSVDEQVQLWKDFSEEYGEDYCKEYLAVPGYSEHHTGLAIDVCLVKDGEVIYENDDMIAEREIFAEVHKLLPKYGFILRYLEGRDETTGYAYEPWHFRYVGSEEIAKEITEKGLTLEEYLKTN